MQLKKNILKHSNKQLNTTKQLHRKCRNESVSRNELIRSTKHYRTPCLMKMTRSLLIALTVSGWEWSMMARETAARMRPVWAASWLRWSRPRFTATIGPAAANRSSTDTSSKKLFLTSALILSIHPRRGFGS